MHPKHRFLLENSGEETRSQSASNLRDVLIAASALTNLNETKDDISKSERALDEKRKEEILEQVKLSSLKRLTQAKSSNESEEDDGARAEGDNDLSKHFPEKLMDMLEDERSSDSICWHPHGKDVVIVNSDKLAKKVLPRFFQDASFHSFVRLLYRYGFEQQRSLGGGKHITFFHKHFQRGKREEALSFVRPVTSKIEPKATEPAMALRDLHRAKNFDVSSSVPSHKLPSSFLDRNGVMPYSSLSKFPNPLYSKSWSFVAPTSFQKTALSRQLVKMSSSNLAHKVRMDAVKRDLGLKGLDNMPKQRSKVPVTAVKKPLRHPLAEAQPSYGEDIIRAAIDALHHAS